MAPLGLGVGGWLMHQALSTGPSNGVTALTDCCRERLRAALEDVCGKAAADSIRLQVAKDGSVLGAAYLGVAAAQFEGTAGHA